eukprot:scaffold274561_cov31-Tisochrysis_lutea.AAC.4
MQLRGVPLSSAGTGSCQLKQRRTISSFSETGSLHKERAPSSGYGKESCHIVDSVVKGMA